MATSQHAVLKTCIISNEINAKLTKLIQTQQNDPNNPVKTRSHLVSAVIKNFLDRGEEYVSAYLTKISDDKEGKIYKPNSVSVIMEAFFNWVDNCTEDEWKVLRPVIKNICASGQNREQKLLALKAFVRPSRPVKTAEKKPILSFCMPKDISLEFDKVLFQYVKIHRLKVNLTQVVGSLLEDFFKLTEEEQKQILIIARKLPRRPK